MTSYFCSYQEQITAAIQAGQWPDGADTELLAHAETCEPCKELVLVAQTLRQSRTTAIEPPRPLPSPGILWWRAQIRRRNAAIESVTRPIAIAEIVALLVVLLAAVALVAWQYQQLAGWFSSVWGPLSSVTQIPGLIVLGLGTLVIFGGFA